MNKIISHDPKEKAIKFIKQGNMHFGSINDDDLLFSLKNVSSALDIALKEQAKQIFEGMLDEDGIDHSLTMKVSWIREYKKEWVKE